MSQQSDCNQVSHAIFGIPRKELDLEGAIAWCIRQTEYYLKVDKPDLARTEYDFGKMMALKSNPNIIFPPFPELDGYSGKIRE